MGQTKKHLKFSIDSHLCVYKRESRLLIAFLSHKRWELSFETKITLEVISWFFWQKVHNEILSIVEIRRYTRMLKVICR